MINRLHWVTATTETGMCRGCGVRTVGDDDGLLDLRAELEKFANGHGNMRSRKEQQQQLRLPILY
jgi:hypothetical protein